MRSNKVLRRATFTRVTTAAARVVGLLALIAVFLAARPVRADAVDSGCTGKNVVQQAPYSCSTTRTIGGIEVTADLDVDVNGRAVVTFTISPPQAVDVPVAIHNYTGISGEPRLYLDGVIPAGTTTATLVVDQVKCGQFDIKAVHTRAGEREGHIAGPVLSWGQNCTVTPTTPPSTIPPSTIAPTTTPPVRVLPSTVTAASLPPTGPQSVATWPVVAGMLAVGAAAIAVSRIPRRHSG